jgi:TPR repeat protein
MKVSLNQGLSLVLIAMMGLTFSACTGVTETPESSKNQPQSKETASVENHVIQKVPSKYMSLLAKAEKGNAQAQYDIATLFNEGEAVKEDPQESFQWFKKAADNGHVESQYRIGSYYSTGIKEVCKQDYQQALNYFKKAADNGHVESQYITAAYYSAGDQMGLTKDEHQGYVYAKKAALQGNAKAQNLLGSIYSRGAGGVEKNEVMAYAWADMAAKQGLQEAVSARDGFLSCPIFRRNSLAQGEALSAALEKRLPKEKKS